MSLSLTPPPPGLSREGGKSMGPCRAETPQDPLRRLRRLQKMEFGFFFFLNPIMRVSEISATSAWKPAVCIL